MNTNPQSRSAVRCHDGVTGFPASTSTSKNGTAKGQNYEMLAIYRTLALARAAFAAAIADKPAGRFMIPSRTRVVKRHPESDW
jgi:hypothetical protein